MATREFKAPENWLARFKELAEYECHGTSASKGVFWMITASFLTPEVFVIISEG